MTADNLNKLARDLPSPTEEEAGAVLGAKAAPPAGDNPETSIPVPPSSSSRQADSRGGEPLELPTEENAGEVTAPARPADSLAAESQGVQNPDLRLSSLPPNLRPSVDEVEPKPAGGGGGNVKNPGLRPADLPPNLRPSVDEVDQEQAGRQREAEAGAGKRWPADERAEAAEDQSGRR
jgi:hypothetical protein